MPTQKLACELFTAALSIIAKNWKQPRCPSIGEWLNKLWHTHVIQYYSVIKINAPSNYEKTWENLTCVSLSEGSQSENVTYSMISTTTFWRRQNHREEHRAFLSSETILYDTVIVDTCHYTMSKPMELGNTEWTLI